jgi:hypothetical protein
MAARNGLQVSEPTRSKAKGAGGIRCRLSSESDDPGVATFRPFSSVRASGAEGELTDR